jgi:hypothetical protein
MKRIIGWSMVCALLFGVTVENRGLDFAVFLFGLIVYLGGAIYLITADY